MHTLRLMFVASLGLNRALIRQGTRLSTEGDIPCEHRPLFGHWCCVLGSLIAILTFIGINSYCMQYEILWHASIWFVHIYIYIYRNWRSFLIWHMCLLKEKELFFEVTHVCERNLGSSTRVIVSNNYFYTAYFSLYLSWCIPLSV